MSAEWYKNGGVHFLIIKKLTKFGQAWKMLDKNISDLVLKEIHGICETKNSRKKQINNYKITER